MFELSDARELKNGKYINVSISDSKYNERAVMLEYLFKHKNNIKNVALTFDGFGLAHYKNNFRIMYKEHISLFDKFGIYMNGFVPYQCFITLSKKEKCIGRIHDFYGPVKISKATKGDYKFKEEDFKQGKDFQTKSDFTKDDDFLEQYLLKYIKENPHTTFHMVLPPYSVLMYNQKNLYEEREFLKHYLTIFSKYPNVKFYAFNNCDFTYNLNNYSGDKRHYISLLNSLINRAINEQTNILTLENFDKYFKEFSTKTRAFNKNIYKQNLQKNIQNTCNL